MSHQHLEKLQDHQIAERAATVPDWTLGDQMISRDFEFADFKEAMTFVNGVAELANERDHHPDITISYNHVHLDCTTHKAGGLTEYDFSLAEAIDRLI